MLDESPLQNPYGSVCLTHAFISLRSWRIVSSNIECMVDSSFLSALEKCATCFSSMASDEKSSVTQIGVSL